MAISRKLSKSRRPTARNGRAESAKSREKREAIERLKEWGLRPDDVIYTIVKSVAASGMSRTIELYRIESCDSHGYVRKYNLTRLAATITGLKLSKDRFGNDSGVTIRGAGMDMGADLVERLAYETFGSDKALRQEWF